MSNPGAPSDNTTLSAILADLEDQGWRTQFGARPDGMVRCFACQTEHPAAGFPVDGIRRTEGASDPADMLAISTVTCPSCGARGILTLNYGPDCSAEDADVLLALHDDRRDGEVSSTQ